MGEDKLRWLDILTEEQARLRALVKQTGSSDTAHTIQDRGGVIVAANREAERVLGLTWGQLTGRDARDMRWGAITEDGEPLQGNQHPSILAMEAGTRIEDAVMGVLTPPTAGGEATGLGNTRWLMITATAIKDEDGNTLGVLAEFTDITETDRGRTASWRMQNAYQLTAGTNADAVALLNPEGTIQWISPGITNLTGQRPAQMLGMHCADIIHPEDRAKIEQHPEDPGKEGATHYLVRVQGGEGESLWSEVTKRAILDAEGSVTGRLVTLRNIDQQVRERQQREAAEALYKLIAENTEGAVLLSNKAGETTWVSPSIERLLGYTPEEAAKLGGTQLIHPSDLEAAALTMEAGLSGHDNEEHPLRMRHKNGEYRWMAGAVRVPEGHDDEFIFIIRDIHEKVLAGQALEAGKARLERVLDASGLGLWDYDILKDEIVVDERWAGILGYTLEQIGTLNNETWQGWMHPQDREREAEASAKHRMGLTPSYDIRVRKAHRSGNWIWVHERGRITGRDAAGRPTRMAGTSQDVSAVVAEEAAKAEQAERLRVALDNSPDAITRFNPDLTIEYANPRVWQMTGRPADAWVGTTLLDHGYPEERARMWCEKIASVFATGKPVTFEVELEREGETVWYESLVNPEFDSEGNVAHALAANRDITERVQTQRTLERLTTRDHLTGLSNRPAMLAEAARALGSSTRSGHRTAVLMIDLDRFKLVNDSLGHGAGDELLRRAAARLQGCVRDEDLVARLGGDEFVVVMRDLDNAGAAIQAAWRIVEEFREPFNFNGHELLASASVGIALSEEGSTPEDLLREADTAMYAAKDSGRDRVGVFNEELREIVSARLSIEGGLRSGMARDEFRVWYQPEVDLESGRIQAVEALARWQHPDGTVWEASRFVEVAEEAGLIVDMGTRILMEACKQGGIWARKGTPVTVRVNVSAHQLSELGLLETLDRALAESGLDPRLLCIEVTETALVKESVTAETNLAGVHARGVRVALDDFGTGYASLSYLTRYSMDILKIDTSFVAGASRSQHGRNLVASIIAMASILGMGVTAEGVETPEQEQLLRTLGCPSGQGYLYSKAVPAHEVDELIAVRGLKTGDH